MNVCHNWARGYILVDTKSEFGTFVIIPYIKIHSLYSASVAPQLHSAEDALFESMADEVLPFPDWSLPIFSFPQNLSFLRFNLNTRTFRTQKLVKPVGNIISNSEESCTFGKAVPNIYFLLNPRAEPTSTPTGYGAKP